MNIKTLFAITLLLLTAACTHDKNTQCIGGSGGEVEVVVFAKHNGVIIPNYDSFPDTAFVKYNTTSSPGTNPTAYDAYFIGEGGEDHIHCTHLKCGSYYIYRTAYDSVTNTRYTGGIGLEFSKTNGEVDTTVLVN